MINFLKMMSRKTKYQWMMSKKNTKNIYIMFNKLKQIGNVLQSNRLENVIKNHQTTWKMFFCFVGIANYSHFENFGNQ